MSTTETASSSGPKAVDLAELKTKVRAFMFQKATLTIKTSFVAGGETEGEGGLPKHAAARL